MFFNDIHKVGKTTCGMENFSFPVNNVFLKIKSRRFRNTEILHVIIDGQSHFFADSEEVINGCSAGKYDSCVVQD